MLCAKLQKYVRAKSPKRIFAQIYFSADFLFGQFSNAAMPNTCSRCRNHRHTFSKTGSSHFSETEFVFPFLPQPTHSAQCPLSEHCMFSLKLLGLSCVFSFPPFSYLLFAAVCSLPLLSTGRCFEYSLLLNVTVRSLPSGC